MFLKRTSVLALVGFFAMAALAQATIIVEDQFSDVTNDASISARTPDGVNLPGGYWGTTAYQAMVFNGNTSGGNSHVTSNYDQACAGAGISIASAGSYTMPSVIQISADIQPGNASGSAGDATYPRGSGVGVWSSRLTITRNGDATYGNNTYPIGYFTGLILDNSGNLNFIDTTSSGTSTSVGTPVAYGGTFNAASHWYTLTYDIGTTTGTISNISLVDVTTGTASTASYSSLEGGTSVGITSSTPAKYAGFLEFSSTGNKYNQFDNFQVASVPEPSSIVLLVTGLVGLLAYAWRKRR